MEFNKENKKRQIGRCEHRRIKRNYPFGRHSNAHMFCKRCGAIIKNKDLKEIRDKKKGGRK